MSPLPRIEGVCSAGCFRKIMTPKAIRNAPPMRRSQASPSIRKAETKVSPSAAKAVDHVGRGRPEARDETGGTPFRQRAPYTQHPDRTYGCGDGKSNSYAFE